MDNYIFVRTGRARCYGTVSPGVCLESEENTEKNFAEISCTPSLPNIQCSVKTNACMPRKCHKTRNWAPKNDSSAQKHLELKCFSVKLST